MNIKSIHSQVLKQIIIVKLIIYLDFQLNIQIIHKKTFELLQQFIKQLEW